MKFNLLSDDEHTGWSNYRVSEGGTVHMGVYRVLFGFRVRCGMTSDKMCCALDWCGGANWKDVERLYSLCLGILSQKDENNFSFMGIPTVSSIKPFYLDEKFVSIVGKLAGDFELLTLTQPEELF